MRLTVGGVVLTVLAVAVGGCSHAGASRSTTTTTSASAAGHVTTSTKAPGTTTTLVTAHPTVTTTLAVNVCPSTFGVKPTANTPPPATMSATIPATLVGKLAVYSDSQGLMKLVAPAGWQCSAMYGADGSGGVSVYPAGSTSPAGGPGPNAAGGAVVGSETSSCVGCTEGQACAVFATAAADFQHDYGASCPSTKPAAETLAAISTGVVSFTDPAGVKGDGNPSGGPNPAYGVMTYYSNNPKGSWLDTCTMPAADQAECSAVLDIFVSWYGAD